MAMFLSGRQSWFQRRPYDGNPLRLPVRSLLRFKSVSKHYYFLISSPTFKLPHIRKSPLGLFIPVRSCTRLEYEFVPFDIENPVKPPLLITPDFARNVEGSCNGIILCFNHIFGRNKEDGYVIINKYCVYNPTINHFTVLSGFGNFDTPDRYGMTLVFDPSVSPHCKIVYFCYIGMNEMNCQIEIYSLQTHTCKPSYKFSLGEDVDSFYGGVYWNNAIHWLHHTGFILYFKLDQEIVYQIKTPFALLGLDHKDYSNYIFESQDHLLLVEISRPLTSKFKIYELKRDYSGWAVKYHVDLDQVATSFPEIMNHDSRVSFKFFVLAIELGEREDDSFLVLDIPVNARRFKVVRLNLVSKTFHKLHDITSPTQNYYGKVRIWPVIPFVESRYNV